MLHVSLLTLLKVLLLQQPLIQASMCSHSAFLWTSSFLCFIFYPTQSPRPAAIQLWGLSAGNTMKVHDGCDLLQVPDEGPKLEPTSVTSYQAVLYMLPWQHSRPHLWHVTLPWCHSSTVERMSCPHVLPHFATWSQNADSPWLTGNCSHCLFSASPGSSP